MAPDPNVTSAANTGSTIADTTDAAPAASSTGSTNSTNRLIQIPESEWNAMQADLTQIKTQLETDRKAAADKKAQEAQKKHTSPQTKFGARFYLDVAGDSQNDDAVALTGQDTTGAKFREIRCWLRGSLYDTLEYNYTLEFCDKKTTMKDMYAGLYNTPTGVDFRVGHFFEPWSIEEISTSGPHPFMERSPVRNMQSLCGGRNIGLMFHNWHDADRFTWAAGAFVSSMTEEFTNFTVDSNLAFTTRLTFLPFYCENAEKNLFFWHLGAAYSYRHYNQEAAATSGTSVSVRPGANLASAVLKTGTMWGLESMNALQVETCLCYGSFSIDAEQTIYFLNDDYCGNATIQGGYVLASWFLTGESRNYQKAGAKFVAVDPREPFVDFSNPGVFCGMGAWELAYRFSWLDFSELVSGYDAGGLLGKSWSHTIGLNWYWCKNCRVMFNYVNTKTDYAGRNAGKTGIVDVVETRFQVAF